MAAVEGVALLVLGSYGRRELCPGSDVDVLLLRATRGGPSADDFRSQSMCGTRCGTPDSSAGTVRER